MAAYLGYTLRTKMLFRGWPIMVHDTHTRRRRRFSNDTEFILRPSFWPYLPQKFHDDTSNGSRVITATNKHTHKHTLLKHTTFATLSPRVVISSLLIIITDLYSAFGSEDTGAQYRFLAVPPLGQTGKQRHNVPSCPLFRPSFHSFKFVTATLWKQMNWFRCKLP